MSSPSKNKCIPVLIQNLPLEPPSSESILLQTGLNTCGLRLPKLHQVDEKDLGLGPLCWVEQNLGTLHWKSILPRDVNGMFRDNSGLNDDRLLDGFYGRRTSMKNT